MTEFAATLWGDPYWKNLPPTQRLHDLTKPERSTFEKMIRAMPRLLPQTKKFTKSSFSDTPDCMAFGYIHVDNNLVEHFEIARKYLGQSSFARSILVALEQGLECGALGKARVQIMIQSEPESQFQYIAASHTLQIKWNPFYAMIDKDGNTVSPALVLIHECIHAVHFCADPIRHYLRRITNSEIAANLEEEITLVQERIVARQLGEGVRSIGSGAFYPVSMVTLSICLYPERKQFDAFMSALTSHRRNTQLENREGTRCFFAPKRMILDYMYEQLSEYSEYHDSQLQLRSYLRSDDAQQKWRKIGWDVRVELVNGKKHLVDIFP